MTKELIIKLIMSMAPQYNLDPKLVIAVVEVESKFNVNAKGAIGERGLMQLHPKYYEGDKYFDVKTNLIAGMSKLSKVKKLCKHKNDKTFVVCYNLGLTGGSRLKYPKLHRYYVKVMSKYKDLNQSERKVAASGQSF